MLLLPYTRVLQDLKKETSDFANLLAPKGPLREANDLRPFFKTRPHLSAAFGFANANLPMPDRLAQEIELFGNFRCDVAIGNSRSQQFTLVELEDATESSIFRIEPRRNFPRWSHRFEEGFSQLVDWAWRIAHERPPAVTLEPIFGCANPRIHYLLVIGRQQWLTASGETRLEWRRNHNGIANQYTSIWTYDYFLEFIERRIEAAELDIAQAQASGSAERTERPGH